MAEQYHLLNGKEARYMSIRLTPEQQVRVSENPNIDIERLGFVEPENIVNYWCDKCSESHTAEPIANVTISARREGRPSVEVDYRCGRCERGFIYYGYLQDAEGIDPKFITSDETGEYKIPTAEDIECELESLLEEAREGSGDSLERFPLSRKLGIIQNKAKKIDYPILAERVEDLKTTWQEAYLTRMQEGLPALIEEILSLEHGFSLYNSGDGEIPAYEGTGLAGMVNPLLEALPHLDIPEDERVREGIKFIFEQYLDMYKSLRRDVEKKRDKLEDRVSSLSDRIIDNSNKLFDFLKKTRASEEEIVRRVHGSD